MFLPEGGLAVSITSIVWLGVIVVCSMNLRFGWSLAGLIIPGFLVPLFILRPASAIINIIEGTITYLVTRKISNLGPNLNLWDSFYGRSRFLAIIIVSVLVRLILDGYLLGNLSNYLQNNYNYQINYYINLNSYGLIIVSLIANQFWENGFNRQFVPFVIVTLLTYLLVRYGLMEFSNFRISQIGSSLYTNIDEIFKHSAKSYIILIVTALLASNMTSRFGWDYGGVLVAALLALQCYSPMRFSMTLIEALFIYNISAALLKIEFFAKANIVNARKILLFFNVGFIYKIIVGYAVMALLPGVRVLEFYGFGYLLSTLIALKMHNSNSYARVSLMLIVTSVSGFLLGSAIALILNFSDVNVKVVLNKTNNNIIQLETEQGYLVDIIENYKQTQIQTKQKPLEKLELQTIFDIDNSLIDPLVKTIKSGDQKQITNVANSVNSDLALYGYKLSLFEDLLYRRQLLILKPIGELNSNWGIYVFAPKASSDYLVEVPRPFDEINTLNFAVTLFQQLDASSLLIGGSISSSNRDRSSDLTRPQAKNSLYNIVSQILLRDHTYSNPVIQVRGFSWLEDNESSLDLLVAFSNGAVRSSQLLSFQQKFLDYLNNQNFSYNLVASDAKTAGYEVGQLFLARYLVQTPNKDLAVVWLSPNLRQSLRPIETNLLVLSQYKALDITFEKTSFDSFLKSNHFKQWLPNDELRTKAEQYLKSQDLLALKNFKSESKLTITHYNLIDDGKDYLVLSNDDKEIAGMLSLSEADVSQDWLINLSNLKNDIFIKPDLSSRRWILFKEDR